MSAVSPDFAIALARVHAEAASKADAALVYVLAGAHLIPCVPGGKEPACANGVHDATNDPEKICAWWRENPEFNIGLAPDRSGLFVLDVDGEIGEQTLAALELEHGTLPLTLAVRTPRGGWHLYFRGRCASTVGKLGPKIDTRGYGGYVLLPPSVVAGKSYALVPNEGAKS